MPVWNEYYDRFEVYVNENKKLSGLQWVKRFIILNEPGT